MWCIRDIIPYGIIMEIEIHFTRIEFNRFKKKKFPNKEIMILSDAYKEIFKNENLTENLNNLSNEFKDQ